MHNNSLIIKMDFREGNTKIAEILIHEYKMKVIKTQLRTGDYLINNEIVVERKTSRDFVQSIIDGRLFRQAGMMRKHFDFSLFIIECGNILNTTSNIHPHAIKGALISLTLAWQIPVLFTRNVRDTALLLWLIKNQHPVPYQNRKFFCRQGRKPKEFRKKQLYILQGLPDIGPKLAIQLLNQFESVKAVFSASANDLMKIPGLGKIKAERIMKAISKQ